MLKSKLGVDQYKFLIIGLVMAVFLGVVAQSLAQTQPVPGGVVQPPRGPSEENISPNYREPKKDPFYDERLFPKKTAEPIKTGSRHVAAEPTPVAPPNFEERDAAWKRRREDARLHGQPEPSPSEKYLIDELKIRGIYSKADGKGVFMKPSTSATTMLFATTGQKFWNGSISRIDKDKIEVDVITPFSDGEGHDTTKHSSETRNFTRGK